MKTALQLLLILSTSPVGCAHEHFYAGVTDVVANGEPDEGEPLQFWISNQGDGIFRLLPKPIANGGYFWLDDNPRTLSAEDSFSFAALSDGQESDDDHHAHTGAYLWVEITSVTGPAGATFGFWDADRSPDQFVPTVSLPVNQPTGSHAFVVSGGFDREDQDPHGHFHGRAWTADKPGDYQVGFRLVDRSTTSPGGGPWHPPSATLMMHFKAGPDFQPEGRFVPGTGYILTWPSQMGVLAPRQPGMIFSILRGPEPAGSAWTVIGSVVGTTAASATFTDPLPPPGKSFYRLAYGWGGTEP